MNSEIKHIIEKAKELSKLINDHEVAGRYKRSISSLKNDSESQEILEELISFGKEISDGTASSASAEYTLLKEKLDKNNLVKNHLTVQREYIYLLQNVMEKIKKPE